MNRSRSSISVEQLESRTLLNAGSLRVALGVVNSVENYTNEVTGLYQQLLNRAPDPAGLNGWVNSMVNGMPLEQVEASITSSDEFFADNGGTNSGYVQGLYKDILNRTPDTNGMNGWLAQLNAGGSRAGVSAAFSYSPEKQADVLTADYVNLLGRNPNPGDIAGWLAQPNLGGTRNELETLFVGSDEFFQTQGQGNPQTYINAAYEAVLHRLPAGGTTSSGGTSGGIGASGQGPNESSYWMNEYNDAPEFAQ